MTNIQTLSSAIQIGIHRIQRI